MNPLLNPRAIGALLLWAAAYAAAGAEFGRLFTSPDERAMLDAARSAPPPDKPPQGIPTQRPTATQPSEPEVPQARVTLEFVDALREVVGVPVETFDERYTSADAEATLRAQGVKARRIRERVDEVAAATILQGWLEARQGSA